MTHRLRKHLTYANVVSSMCLFILLGGSAYAASKLPKNSVGSRQIRDGAVKAGDLGRGAVGSRAVRNGSLGTSDFKRGLLRSGSQGARRPTGKRGATGRRGATGPRGTTAASRITMRRGAGVNVAAASSNNAEASCGSGERATGGGLFSDAAGIDVAASYPLPNSTTGPPTGNASTPTGWRVRAANAGTAASTVYAYVVCASP